MVSPRFVGRAALNAPGAGLVDWLDGWLALLNINNAPSASLGGREEKMNQFEGPKTRPVALTCFGR